MASSSFGGSLTVTYIGTATALLKIDDATFITDPYFSPPGSEFDVGITLLKSSYEPALGLADLPPVDAVLLSHEDHPDNLDDLGRRLLDARPVVTTPDGARKLAPRPGVVGLAPWQKTTVTAAGRAYEIVGTPCVHLPGGECTGFIVRAPHFGTATDGKPNVIYFTGDTVYVDELERIGQEYHVSAALFNLGGATIHFPDGKDVVVTLDGKGAAKLFKAIRPDVVVPLHFDGWEHFVQPKADLRKELEDAGVLESFKFLEPGVATKIL